MGGYPALSGHPFHHYFVAGPYALLALVLPLLVLALLVALWSTACWVVRKVVAHIRRFTTPVAAPRPGDRGLLQMLASDLERDATARAVSQAIGEGRLTLEEGGARIDAALRARHRSELARLVADLPPLPPGSSGMRGQPSISPALRAAWIATGAALVFAAMLVQAIVGLWELWPAAVAAFGVSALLPRR